MKTLGVRLARVASGFRVPKIEDACAVSGILFVSGGVALVFPPAGLIVLGVMLLVIAIGATKSGSAE